jgi:predicted nucleic acid-binding protein
MKDICVDAGFLIGLYNVQDEFHDRATQYFLSMFDKENNCLVIPWPILYETVRTKTVRNRDAMLSLERDWKYLLMHKRLTLLSDVPFREDVVDECFSELRKPDRQRRNLSIVDRVIRRILSDRSVRIDVFITFNPKDFADVCKTSQREMLS